MGNVVAAILTIHIGVGLFHKVPMRRRCIRSATDAEDWVKYGDEMMTKRQIVKTFEFYNRCWRAHQNIPRHRHGACTGKCFTSHSLRLSL